MEHEEKGAIRAGARNINVSKGETKHDWVVHDQKHSHVTFKGRGDDEK